MLTLVLFLKNALERVFVFGSKRENIRHFLLGFFARVSAADSFLPIVDRYMYAMATWLGIPKKCSNTPTTKSIGVWSSFNSNTS